MSCFEREQLFGYAHRLLDEKELAAVRAHLGECSKCGEVVESYNRMDAVLEEWKPVDPTAWFDAHVRQAVLAQPPQSTAWGFWGMGWVRGVALATLAILVVSGVIWFTRRPRVIPDSSTVAARHLNPPAPTPAAPEVATVNHAVVPPPHPERPLKAATVVKSGGAPTVDDEDAVTADDDELLANFDVLSELPKTETQVAN